MEFWFQVAETGGVIAPIIIYKYDKEYSIRLCEVRLPYFKQGVSKMVIEKVDVENEKELQQLLFENPGAIENGLRFIAKEVPAHGNRKIDLLGQDEDGSLVIVELKLEAHEDLLVQVLDYADFAFRHFRILFERFPELKAKDDFDPYDDIRVMVVAENFDEVFRRVASHVERELEAFKYQAFETEDGTKSIICIQEDIPELPYFPREELISEASHLDYIRDEKARLAANQLLEFLKALGSVEVVPTQYYLGVKHKRNFAVIRTRRNYFYVWYRDSSTQEWEMRINTPDDITEKLEIDLKDAFEATK